MADLLAKQDLKSIAHHRGQEVEGTIIAILQDIVIDLGTKSEGILPKKDLSPEQAANLKVGDKIVAFVIHPENESGQVVLGLERAISKGAAVSTRWNKFTDAQKGNQVLSGKGLEVNKGGLIVEVNGIRGFLPSSQVALAQASNLDQMVGQDISVTVIEVDPAQNRLIFSQKNTVTEETKKKLSKLKVGDKVEGKVAAVLQFGIFVTLEDNVEGLVHISEISWDKMEDINGTYKVGDDVKAKVIAVDSNTGRVNLSIKQLSADPFVEAADKYQPDDIIKATISRINANGIFFALDNAVEGIIPTNKLDADTNYEVGQTITCLVDTVDLQKRRVNLTPFITSTKDLIYK